MPTSGTIHVGGLATAAEPSELLATVPRSALKSLMKSSCPPPPPTWYRNTSVSPGRAWAKRGSVPAKERCTRTKSPRFVSPQTPKRSSFWISSSPRRSTTPILPLRLPQPWSFQRQLTARLVTWPSPHSSTPTSFHRSSLRSSFFLLTSSSVGARSSSAKVPCCRPSACRKAPISSSPAPLLCSARYTAVRACGTVAAPSGSSPPAASAALATSSRSRASPRTAAGGILRCAAWAGGFSAPRRVASSQAACNQP
mmetsp:Transcript_102506/g.330766  ORF Transcript_102506/g.330766 Transcript_102506/m.330766 type:complete len:254 (-) Transcript_102506:941-1702(-)